MADSTDEAHARHLAKGIEAYWRKLGYPDVKASVERINVFKGDGAWAVKSNLKNGLPVGCSARDLARLSASVRM